MEELPYINQYSDIFIHYLLAKEENNDLLVDFIDAVLIEDCNEKRSTLLLTEKNNKEIVLTDQLVIHLLELTKIEEEPKRFDNKLFNWLYYFKYEGIKEDVIRFLFKTDDKLLKEHNEYDKFRQNDRVRNLYHDRLIYEMEKNTLIEQAKIDGRLEGKIEGQLEKSQNKLIKQMTKKFGLTEDEINLIQNCKDISKLDQALEDILFFDNKEDILKYLR